MADISKIKLADGSEVLIKDAAGRARLGVAESAIEALKTSKQNVINDSNKLAAAYVSLTKPEGTKLASTDVQAAVYELESAIETGGTGSVVTVEKQETAESGYVATYVIKQGGEAVTGPKINIPKDYLVKSASIKTVTKADEPYSGAKVGDKYIDFVINVKEGSATDEHLYLPVNELVDAYLGDEETIHLDSATNTFSVKAVAMDKVTGLADALALKADQSALAAEIVRAEAAEALKFDIADAGALAYKDSATGTVPAQTISGVKATGNLSGSASITLASTPTAASLTKGDFTPAGSITGDAIKDGSVEVTLADAAQTTEATVTAGDYTPAGTVSKPSITVTPSNDTIQPVASVGTMTTLDISKFNGGAAATWTGASHTPASLGNATKSAFATNGIVAAMGTGEDVETLIFTAATTSDAVTEQGAFTPDEVNFGTFSGGSAASLGEGFYAEGSAPTLGTAKTFLTGASAALDAAPTFTGTKEENMKVTKVEYKKQVVSNTTFTGTAATLGFSGTTAKDVLITAVNYDKANASQTGSVAITDAELAVGDIAVAAKNVTVE